MEYYSTFEKGNPVAQDNMDELGGYYISEISESQEDKYCMS